MRRHKGYAGVYVFHHLTKVLVVDHFPGAGRIESPSRSLEILIVVYICPHIVGQLLEAMLFVEEIFALGAKGGRLGLDGLEGVGH